MRRAVVGLGNPGVRYALTRHNVGFLVAERLAQRLGIALDVVARDAISGRGSVDGVETVVMKPVRFMNRSGEVVAELLAAGGIEPRDLLVVHDEIDLPPGRVKLKRGGGTAGHRGLQSIVEALGQADFARARVGVGRPSGDAAEHVLAPFAPGEHETLATALEAAADAIILWLRVGIEAAMNRVNARPAGPGRRAPTALERVSGGC